MNYRMCSKLCKNMKKIYCQFSRSFLLQKKLTFFVLFGIFCLCGLGNTVWQLDW